MLTDKAIRAMKPDVKSYRKSDMSGLYLEVRPSGRKAFAMSYRVNGAQRTRRLGEYPEVSLAEARAERDRIRLALRDGEPIDAPSAPIEVDVATTFGEVAKRFAEKRRKEGTAPATQVKLGWQIDKMVAAFGDRPIESITTKDVITLLRREESKGRHETAHRVRATASQIFRFAAAEGRVGLGFDPADVARDALVKKSPAHHPGLTAPRDVGALMAACRGYETSLVVRAGLLTLAYTFLRPGEVRFSRWREIDWSRNVWAVPGPRMKQKEAHIVPLSRQARGVLAELHDYTGHGDLMFPGNRSEKRCLSETTFNSALRRLGYDKHIHVPHGFRTTASTLLNERSWNSDWIEKQLSHKSADKIRESYNAALYIDGRTRMMQAYADLLDELEASIARGRPRAG